MFNEIYSQYGADIGVGEQGREREGCSRAVEHVRTGTQYIIGSGEQACGMHVVINIIQ